MGALLGGSALLALGACMIALSARCSVHSGKHHWAVISLGIFALLILVAGGLTSFTHITSVSVYENSTSPLSVLFVLAVGLLVQCFLILPLEDDSRLAFLRKEITVLAVFSGISFVGIVLTYVLSYALYGSAMNEYLDGSFIPDFHYLEGAISLAIVLTGMRGVLRAYMGKEQIGEIREENVDETA